jgi:hypothetical protein
VPTGVSCHSQAVSVTDQAGLRVGQSGDQSFLLGPLQTSGGLSRDRNVFGLAPEGGAYAPTLWVFCDDLIDARVFENETAGVGDDHDRVADRPVPIDILMSDLGA